MKTSAVALYEGELKCKVSKAGSETCFVTDAKDANDAFSPTDILAGALASCVASMIAFTAAQQGLEMKGLQVDVAKEMQTSPMRVKTFEVTVKFPKMELTNDMKRRLEGAAKSCPVKNSLNPDIAVAISFEY